MIQPWKFFFKFAFFFPPAESLIMGRKTPTCKCRVLKLKEKKNKEKWKEVYFDNRQCRRKGINNESCASSGSFKFSVFLGMTGSSGFLLFNDRRGWWCLIANQGNLGLIINKAVLNFCQHSQTFKQALVLGLDTC